MNSSATPAASLSLRLSSISFDAGRSAHRVAAAHLALLNLGLATLALRGLLLRPAR